MPLVPFTCAIIIIIIIIIKSFLHKSLFLFFQESIQLYHQHRQLR
jgi:hypothetical protein